MYYGKKTSVLCVCVSRLVLRLTFRDVRGVLVRFRGGEGVCGGILA